MRIFRIGMFYSFCSCFAALGMDFDKRYDDAKLQVALRKNQLCIRDKKANKSYEVDLDDKFSQDHIAMDGVTVVKGKEGSRYGYRIAIPCRLNVFWVSNALYIDSDGENTASMAIDSDIDLQVVNAVNYSSLALRSSNSIFNWGNIRSKSWMLASKRVFNFGNIGAVWKDVDLTAAVELYAAHKGECDALSDGAYNFGSIEAKKCTAHNTAFYQHGSLKVADLFTHAGLTIQSTTAQPVTTEIARMQSNGDLKLYYDDNTKFFAVGTCVSHVRCEMFRDGALLYNICVENGTQDLIDLLLSGEPVAKNSRLSSLVPENLSSTMPCVAADSLGSADDKPAVAAAHHKYNMRGMFNIGERTCYAIAAIQALFAMDPIRNSVLVYKDGHEAINALRDLFVELQKGGNALDEEYMRKFWDRFVSAESLPMLEGGRYNVKRDSVEFLGVVCNLLEHNGVIQPSTAHALAAYGISAAVIAYGDYIAMELNHTNMSLDHYLMLKNWIAQALQEYEFFGCVMHNRGHYWLDVRSGAGIVSLDDARVWHDQSSKSDCSVQNMLMDGLCSMFLHSIIGPYLQAREDLRDARKEMLERARSLDNDRSYLRPTLSDEIPDGNCAPAYPVLFICKKKA